VEQQDTKDDIRAGFVFIYLFPIVVIVADLLFVVYRLRSVTPFA